MPATRLCRPLAAVLLVLLIPAAPAVAVGDRRPPPRRFNNMYPTANTPWRCQSSRPPRAVFCQTDKSWLSVAADRTISRADAAVIIRTLGQLQGTHLKVYGERAVTTGPIRTDIVYQRRRLFPSQVLGETWCTHAASAIRCDQHVVRFQAGIPLRPSVVCHETGHAVGLTHGHEAEPRVPNDDPALGCMRTPDSGDGTYGAHNLAEINHTY